VSQRIPCRRSGECLTTESDWLLGSIDEVERKARAAQDALDAVVQSLAETRDERGAGLTMAEIADRALAQGGRETRLRAATAMDEYERAAMTLRGRVIRALIDDGNLSLTEVARRMGVSRQVVTRLYQVGRGSTD
jgi:Trp operon repressor